MVAEGGGTGDVPAGYTYLGQFVDHDLTMDRTDVMLGDDVSPDGPAAGPVAAARPRLAVRRRAGDPASAKFYEADGLHLKTGTTIAVPPTARPRPATTCRVSARAAHQQAKRKALIPDPRNDENLIVAQTHLAMIRFHNRVARQGAGLGAGRAEVHPRPQAGHPALPVADPPRLPAADLPPRRSLDDVFTNGRKLVEPDAAPTAVPTMPVEFSVAAFRLGHSMVRPTLQLEPDLLRQRRARWSTCSRSPGLGGDLGGEIRLITSWLADLRRMYDFPAGGHPELKPAQQRQPRHADRHAAHRPAEEPATERVRRPELDPVRRPAAQPGVPQPDPRQRW